MCLPAFPPWREWESGGVGDPNLSFSLSPIPPFSPRGPAILYRQLGSALGPTGANHASSAGARHPRHESMHAGASSDFGLKCSLRQNKLPPQARIIPQRAPPWQVFRRSDLSDPSDQSDASKKPRKNRLRGSGGFAIMAEPAREVRRPASLREVIRRQGKWRSSSISEKMMRSSS